MPTAAGDEMVVVEGRKRKGLDSNGAVEGQVEKPSGVGEAAIRLRREVRRELGRFLGPRPL